MKKNQKKNIQKNAFFVQNGVVFFVGLFPHKFYISRVIKPKKKRHQIDSFLIGIDAVGRPAGRVDPLLTQSPKKIG